MPLDLGGLLPALANSVAVSLEEGAFIMCWPVDDPGPISEPRLDVDVTLRNPERSIVVGISMTQALARQIAQDTLGEVDPTVVADEDARDAVLELANVIAGRLARSVANDGALVTLDAPTVRAVAWTDGVHLALETDSGAVLRCGLRAATP